MRLQNDFRQLTHHVLTAQEDERHKISHDLQDEIAQTLLGINVRLLSLKTLTEDSTERLKDEVARTQQLVTESSMSVRKYARELDIHQKLPFHRSATRLIESETPKSSLQRKSPSKS